MLEKKYLRESVDKRDLLRFVAIGMDSIKIIYNINTLELNKFETKLYGHFTLINLFNLQPCFKRISAK